MRETTRSVMQTPRAAARRGRRWGLIATAAMATIAASARAQGVRPHTGADAYGDWRTDAPGVARLITPADMPPPYASNSEANGPRIVAPPADAAPRVPPGFTVARWASGLSMPRQMRRAPNGDIFLAESGAGRIRVFRTAPGADHPISSSVFASGLTLPFGIAFWPPADPRFVYVAETDRVVRFPYRIGDTTADGPRQTVVPDLPQGGHWTRDLVATPDGSRLYLSIGSQSNAGGDFAAQPPEPIAAWQARYGIGAAWGPEAGRAVVLTLDPRANALRPFATGLRNCVGLALQPGTATPWCATNERDELGDNLPPDYATHVTAGAFYGWPWYYIGDHEDPRLRGRRPDLAHDVTVPDVLIQPHSAPLGIAFYDGTAFPPEYRGDAFVALHGSWNRGKRTGYKVVRIPFRDGRPTGAYIDFVTGFVASDGDVWARPVGVVMAADGSLLVSEDGHGTIWRVAYDG